MRRTPPVTEHERQYARDRAGAQCPVNLIGTYTSTHWANTNDNCSLGRHNPNRSTLLIKMKMVEIFQAQEPETMALSSLCEQLSSTTNKTH